MGPIFGRDAELLRASAVLARTRQSGSSSLLAITGAPGIGKSALLDAVATLARQQGYRSSRGRAEESTQIVPLAALLSVLRSGPDPLLDDHAFAELGELYDRQPWLVERLADALAGPAAHQPLVVLMDDVQWSDQLSSFALRVVTGRLATHPVCWVLAARTDPGGPLEQVLHAAGHTSNVSRIDLEPLDEHAVHELVHHAVGRDVDSSLARLVRRAEGHPLFIHTLLSNWREETTGGAGSSAGGLEPADGTVHDPHPSPPDPTRADEVPGELVSLVSRQLESLSGEAADLVRTGAVLGRRFSLDDVATLSGRTAAQLSGPLEEAARGGLLGSEDSAVAFHHDLVRQAVYAGLPAPLRSALHRDVVEMMTLQLRPAAHIAPHVLGQRVLQEPGSTGLRERQVSANLLRAAAAEVSRSTPAAAAQLLHETLLLLPADDEGRFDIGLEALDATIAGLQIEMAVDLGRRLLEEAVTAHEAGRVWLRLAGPLTTLSQDGELRTGTADTLANFPPDDRSSIRLQLRAVHARAGSRTAEGSAAEEEARDVLRIATRDSDTGAAESALLALAEAAAWRGCHQEALAPARKARQRHGGPPRSCEIAALTGLEQYDQARLLLAEAAEVHRSDTWETLPEHAWRRALLELFAGRIPLARAEAEHLLHLGQDFEEFAVYRAEAHGILARAAGTRGDPLTGRRHVEAARRLLVPGNHFQRLTLHVVDGRLAEAAGNDDTAASAFARALRLRREHCLSGAGPDYDSAPQIVRVALRAGDRALAEDAAAGAEGYASRNPGIPGIQGIALHARALVERDVATLRRATEVLATSPRVPVYSVAAGDLAALLSVTGELKEARRVWSLASRALSAWGASDLITDPRAVALRSGQGRRRRAAGTTTGWDSLTAAEARVADIVGRGGTNRSVATELSVSPHTVSTHLRSVFVKLGLNSRVQLAHVVAERGRTPPVAPH
ncbi:AAA family ATPase [Kineococcus sp. TBRC 1896]|uniref:AAA family ATPase n=1 Tax=Kineococcus mangrovi TaxID=1660183 RepID=A0ABV4HX64_9ACTN